MKNLRISRTLCLTCHYDEIKDGGDHHLGNKQTFAVHVVVHDSSLEAYFG
jgi:hypothetical protein